MEPAGIWNQTEYFSGQLATCVYNMSSLQVFTHQLINKTLTHELHEQQHFQDLRLTGVMTSASIYHYNLRAPTAPLRTSCVNLRLAWRVRSACGRRAQRAGALFNAIPTPNDTDERSCNWMFAELNIHCSRGEHAHANANNRMSEFDASSECHFGENKTRAHPHPR